MADESPPTVDQNDGSISPHDAFSILANADRFNVIKTLINAPERTLGFNELYRRSGFDDSGQFNYHLNKLVGPFLKKTDDGYRLRHSARIAYRLAVSGLFSDRSQGELTAVAGACSSCGADQLIAVYEDDRLWIRCDDCGRRATVAPFPPRALSYYDTERMPTAFDQYTLGTVLRAAENVCPWCASPLTAELEPATDEWPAVDWIILRECCHCQGWIATRIHDLVRLHPAVISFYHEQGVDILGCSFWKAEAALTDQLTVATEVEPWAVVATFAHDRDTLRLGIADEMRVSTIEQLQAAPESQIRPDDS